MASIHQVAQESGFTEVRRLLRQVLIFTADGPQWRDNVLLDRLFCPIGRGISENSTRRSWSNSKLEEGGPLSSSWKRKP